MALACIQPVAARVFVIWLVYVLVLGRGRFAGAGRPRTFQAEGGGFGWRAEQDDVVEAFGRQLAPVDRAADGRHVAIDDDGVDDAGGPAGVLGEDRFGWEVQDQGDRRDAGRARSLEERSAVFGLRVGGVDHGRLAVGQAPLQALMEDSEGGPRGALVGLVARYHRAHGVGGQDLVGGEQAGRQRGLAGAGRADEHDEVRVGEDQRRHEAGPRPG